MTADRALIDDLRLRLRLEAEADPERAVGQQQYMKSALPYFGVTLPRTVALSNEVFAAHPLESYDDWQDTVLATFREATHRELWYAATALAKWRRYRAHARRLDALVVYETMIVEGAWWDIVDDVSANLVGGLFETDATWTATRMREWATDASLWKRRASVISQLRRRDAVDLDLLYDCIEANLDDRDFFIRKAIGWALRQVAKTQPQEVIQYVEATRERLSPLSKREALKHVRKSGLIAEVP